MLHSEAVDSLEVENGTLVFVTRKRAEGSPELHLRFVGESAWQTTPVLNAEQTQRLGTRLELWRAEETE